MSLLSFFGCALTAYGPALAVFLVYVARSSQLVILFISSAFFWLLSILVSSSICYAVGTSINFHITIGVSVIVQELFRWLFFLLLRKAELGLTQMADKPKSVLNRPSWAVVSGFGFGAMSGLVSYISQLSLTINPGILVCKSCPSLDVFFVSAITTCLFVFLHIVWSMLAFEGWFRRSWLPFAAVFVSHYGASYSTVLVSSSISGGCFYTFLILGAVLALDSFFAFRPILKLKSR
ncbi:gamma-secretase subunit Aph-1 [Polychytrium aggregatum]|uniref:gamma-secretase subunit Aph-1 n=1 Tax=Polychytrium aggregatum TaxID=110093 RepID=UPI0022FE6828|nr:gamma-secretase subunit Aph-1 [Polychytrium aggregatum]KAI9208904.1 gamma-secretase subunit Aph-1 [Polychytrium aggregatum]